MREPFVVLMLFTFGSEQTGKITKKYSRSSRRNMSNILYQTGRSSHEREDR